MPLIAYRDYRPRADAAQIIERANEILRISREDGFGIMTLRQVYYQFISKNWLPENSLQQYKKLGRILADAREGGLIDWFAIEDAGRNPYHFRDCKTVEDLLRGIENGLKINPWEDQDYYCEVWVEKNSLEATIARPVNKLRGGYLACRGYLSVSEAWRAGVRYARQKEKGKKLVLFHLGDHDPSGIDMTRDNRERLQFFAQEHGIEVRRLALNMDQVEQYSPPPNFAKQTDSRFTGYQSQYGDESWELDALRQSVIGDIITQAMSALIDWDKWNASMAREAELRASTRVAEIGKRWAEVHGLLMDDGFPMDRLQTLERLNLSGVASVIRQSIPIGLKDVDVSERSSLHLLQGDHLEDVEAVQAALDVVAAKAEEVAAERAEWRETKQNEAPEVDKAEDFDTDEDDAYGDE